MQTNLERLLTYMSKKPYLNNFQNTISHVKFSEKFESFIRIQVRVKALPKNCADRKKYKKKTDSVLHPFFLCSAIFRQCFDSELNSGSFALRIAQNRVF